LVTYTTSILFRRSTRLIYLRHVPLYLLSHPVEGPDSSKGFAPGNSAGMLSRHFVRALSAPDARGTVLQSDQPAITLSSGGVSERAATRRAVLLTQGRRKKTAAVYLVLETTKETLQTAPGYTYDRSKKVWMPATKQG
jgi:hypothetical protein